MVKKKKRFQMRGADGLRQREMENGEGITGKYETERCTHNEFARLVNFLFEQFPREQAFFNKLPSPPKGFRARPRDSILTLDDSLVNHARTSLVYGFDSAAPFRVDGQVPRRLCAQLEIRLHFREGLHFNVILHDGASTFISATRINNVLQTFSNYVKL